MLGNLAKQVSQANQLKALKNKIMAKKVMLKVASPKTGDPIKVEEKVLYSPGRPQTTVDFDVRDKLAELIGKGNALSGDDRNAIYDTLVKSLGPQKAQKVMTHTYMFNQRPEVQGLPVEDRLRSFYTIGSNDPEVGGLIAKSKSLGYGPVQGFRSSNSAMNQLLAGRIPATNETAVVPEIKKRIMLSTKK